MKAQAWLDRILFHIEHAQGAGHHPVPSRFHSALKYLFAILFQVFLFFLSYQLKREPEVAFALLYLIISVLSTLVLGFGPGLVSATLASFSVNYHYVKPLNQAVLTFHSTAFFFAFVILYGLTVCMFAVLIEAVKRSVSAKKRADEAVLHRDELLEVIAHDLRQPLGAAMMQIQFRKLGPDILHSLQRMDRLISDLLDSSKSEKGTLCLNLDQASLRDSIQEALETVSETAKRKRIELKVDVPAELNTTCQLDNDRMTRVLVNLIGNAIKFTPHDGSVSLSLACPNSSEFEVKIRDSGPGVSSEEQKFLFTKSWQNQKTAHLGTGLGLYISKSIVEAHHGRIWYETPTSGVGAVFAFSVPIQSVADENRVS